MYDPQDYPVVFNLGQCEPTDKNVQFMRELWALDIPNVKKGTSEWVNKIMQDNNGTKYRESGSRIQISIDTFLDNATTKVNAQLVLGVVGIDYSKNIRFISYYKLESDIKETRRDLGFWCSLENEPKLNKLFQQVYGQTFKEYYESRNK